MPRTIQIPDVGDRVKVNPGVTIGTSDLSGLRLLVTKLYETPIGPAVMGIPFCSRNSAVVVLMLLAKDVTLDGSRS